LSSRHKDKIDQIAEKLIRKQPEINKNIHKERKKIVIQRKRRKKREYRE
jgi:hypothetical protein